MFLVTYCLTWKWNITSKLRQYELRVPLFGSLISFALAHSLTCKTSTLVKQSNSEMLINPNKNQLSKKQTSKTISWKRSSISLINRRSLDFTWPGRLSIETSQEMLPWSNFSMGTLARATTSLLCHPSARVSFLLESTFHFHNMLEWYLYDYCIIILLYYIFKNTQEIKGKINLPFSGKILSRYRKISTLEMPGNWLSKLMEISKSPHLVKSWDTNEPNGSTDTPVCHFLHQDQFILLIQFIIS